MLTIRQTNIAAMLDVAVSNTLTIAQIMASIPDVSQTDIMADVSAMEAAGLVTFMAPTEQVALVKTEGAFVVEDDPSIEPAVKAAISDIFSDQGVSLSTFLDGLAARGMSSSDARVGVYVARQLALGIAARRGDDRLRGPLIKAAELLASLSDAFTANGQ